MKKLMLVLALLGACDDLPEFKTNSELVEDCLNLEGDPVVCVSNVSRYKIEIYIKKLKKDKQINDQLENTNG